MFKYLFSITNIIGLIAFAISGTIKGINKKLDLFGITIAGLSTSLAGGIIRDTMVNQIPFLFKSINDISFSLCGVFIGIVLYKMEKVNFIKSSFLLLPDAIGLSAFTTTGAIVGFTNNISPIGIILLSTITGVGGSIVRDVFLKEIPAVLKEEFYATCCIIGSIFFIVTVKLTHNINLSSLICFSITLIFRIFAIKFKWQLPKFQ